MYGAIRHAGSEASRVGGRVERHCDQKSGLFQFHDPPLCTTIEVHDSRYGQATHDVCHLLRVRYPKGADVSHSPADAPRYLKATSVHANQDEFYESVSFISRSNSPRYS